VAEASERACALIRRESAERCRPEPRPHPAAPGRSDQHRGRPPLPRRAMDHYGAEDHEELALRHLFGRCWVPIPTSVLHAVANTPVKRVFCGLLGETIPVLRVKGKAAGILATIETSWPSAVRLDPSSSFGPSMPSPDQGPWWRPSART